jgi:hypothetical protein
MNNSIEIKKRYAQQGYYSSNQVRMNENVLVKRDSPLGFGTPLYSFEHPLLFKIINGTEYRITYEHWYMNDVPYYCLYANKSEIGKYPSTEIARNEAEKHSKL